MEKRDAACCREMADGIRRFRTGASVLAGNIGQPAALP